MTNQQSPSIGRVVHAWVDPASNNGHHIAAAVVTRVWGDDVVNLSVFVDADTGPVRQTSARFVEELPGPDDVPNGYVWTWPPRV
jgi:hypothetical protein